MTNYETFDTATNTYKQNIYANYHFLSNPNWVLNRQPKDDRIRRAISSLNINYSFLKNFLSRREPHLIIQIRHMNNSIMHLPIQQILETMEDGTSRDLMMNSSMLMESFLIQTILVMTLV